MWSRMRGHTDTWQGMPHCSESAFSDVAASMILFSVSRERVEQSSETKTNLNMKVRIFLLWNVALFDTFAASNELKEISLETELLQIWRDRQMRKLFKLDLRSFQADEVKSTNTASSRWIPGFSHFCCADPVTSDPWTFIPKLSDAFESSFAPDFCLRGDRTSRYWNTRASRNERDQCDSGCRRDIPECTWWAVGNTTQLREIFLQTLKYSFS